jgi:septal ring factor EnvC (AmiA/AmiB activator)
MFRSARLAQACLLIAALAAAPSLAQTPQSAREVEALERKRELEILKTELERAEAANAKLKSEIDSLKSDRKQLGQTLQQTTQRIRDIEAKLAATERRLAPLTRQQTELRGSLEQKRELLSQVLGALQRMGRNPPPAVLLHPDDALRSVRAAIMLGAVLPELRTEAETLAAELAELSRLRSETATEQEALKTARATLELERQRLAVLVNERQRALATSEQTLAAERAKAQALGRQTENVRDLINRAEKEIASAANAAAAANRPPKIDPNLSFEDPARSAPAISFAKAKGRLVRPVSGSLLRDYAPAHDPKGQSKGISIETTAGAEVIAPADGWVVFAGPFRAYGNLLILNAGDGYHVLLAGVGTFTVELGQFVRMGEPVAVMALGPNPASGNEAANPRSILYVEFRKDGESIDSGPWWLATDKQKVRG